MASEIHSSPATSCWWRRGASISSKMLAMTWRYGVCSTGRVAAKYLSRLNTLSRWCSSRAATIWFGASGASGGQSNISVVPAPSNNRLKLTAPGVYGRIAFVIIRVRRRSWRTPLGGLRYSVVFQ